MNDINIMNRVPFSADSNLMNEHLKSNDFNQINGVNLMSGKTKHIQAMHFKIKKVDLYWVNISYLISGYQILVTSFEIFLKNLYISSPQTNAFISKLIIA